MNVPSDKVNGNGCAAEQQRTTDDIDGVKGGDYKAITAISSDVSLPNDVLERIFQRYSIKQRCAGLESFLITSVLFDFWVICTVQQDRNYENIGKLFGEIAFFILLCHISNMLHMLRKLSIVYRFKSPFIQTQLLWLWWK